MMTFIRSAVFNVVFYVAFLLLMIVGLPCLAISYRASLRVVRLWAHMAIFLLRAICGTKVEFRNTHHIPKGAAIIAAKHQSFLETFALIVVLDEFAYVLKKELMSIPFFGWYIKGTGQIGIDRGRRGAVIGQLKRSVAEKLRQGRHVIIFPEGTRQPVGAPPAYKSGVSALTSVADVPCIPVAVNTGLFWPKRSFLKRPGTVVIEFLPPIRSDLPKHEFMRLLQASIEPATNALVAAALAADPDLGQTSARNTPATA